MKYIVVDTNLIYYASRYEEDVAFVKMLDTDYKKTYGERKASKIMVDFAKPTDSLHIYRKPRYMIKNYIEEPNIVYVGVFDVDESVLEEDYESINDFCKKKNILPIFTQRPLLGRVIKEILEGKTFRHAFPRNQVEMWEEYLAFNKEMADKLKQNLNLDDVVWIQDHNTLLIPEMIENQNILMSFDLPFSSLSVSIPYYNQIMMSLHKCKVISFEDCTSKLTFDEAISSFVLGDKDAVITTVLPLGTDIDYLKTITDSKEFMDCSLFVNLNNLIVLPYNSPNHLLCIEAYLNEFSEEINVVLLNTGDIDLEAQTEVQRLAEYLRVTKRVNIMSFLPRSDCELYKLLSECKIGMVKSLEGYFTYFNKDFIGQSACDYEQVAAEINSRLLGNDSNDEKIFINPGTAKQHLDTPSVIKERLLNFITPEQTINQEIDGLAIGEYKVNSSDNNLSDAYPIELFPEESHNEEKKEVPDVDKISIVLTVKEDDDKNKTLTSNMSTVEINRSRKIEVTNVSKLTSPQQENKLGQVLKSIETAKNVVLLLDYDGTLTPIVDDPDDAVPSERLLKVLNGLNQKTTINIVTGRTRQDMDKWIPKDINVYSEHGTFMRTNGIWKQLNDVPSTDLAFSVAKFYADRTTGSKLEKKSNGFVFHYRNCPYDIGEKQAASLFEQLKRINPDFARSGKKIVEFRSGGKDQVVKQVKGDLIVAMGDDVTDEDMFAHEDILSIKVGQGKSKAKYFVRDVEEALNFLEKVLDCL